MTFDANDRRENQSRTARVANRLDRIPLRSITIGGEFGERLSINADRRLKAVDIDRLTAPFTDRKSHKRFDGAWVGEHAGKFLDAASKSAAYSGDLALLEMARRCADALIEAQDEDGYLGTCPDGERWSDWDVWTHKYCLIGLSSYGSLFNDQRALTACLRIGDHLIGVFGAGAKDGKRLADIGPHRGMVSTSVLEPVCALYEATGEQRFLEFAEEIGAQLCVAAGPGVVSGLLDHGDTHLTANGKAYEMLSNLCGLVDLYRITGSQKYRDAVDAAFADIIKRQLYETGTVSACEHFQPRGRLLALPSSNIGETCATVTWLQLNQKLWLLTGAAKYANEIERSVYNHLFAAQDRETGHFCYYTPLIGKKEYTDALLCCVSSGARGIALLPELALAVSSNAAVISLYTDFTAAVTVAGAAISIRAASSYPVTGAVKITVRADRPVRFVLRLRTPPDADDFSASVEGRSFMEGLGGWLDIDREWTGDTDVAIGMTLRTRVFGADGRYGGLLGLKRGPQVLALEACDNPCVEDFGRIALPVPLSGEAQARGADATLSSATAQRLLVGRRAGAKVAYSFVDARLTPFADARNFAALMSEAATAKEWLPPATAFARCAMSHEDPYSNREAITDDEICTFATLFADRPSVAALIGRGDARAEPAPVWFAVAIDQMRAPISRVVFRHGAVSAQGGAFDASRGAPVIEAALSPLNRFYEFLPDLYGAAWTPLAALSRYAPAASGGADGLSFREFEVVLDQPIKANAIRIVGWPAGDTVTCAELSGWR